MQDIIKCNFLFLLSIVYNLIFVGSMKKYYFFKTLFKNKPTINLGLNKVSKCLYV